MEIQADRSRQALVDWAKQLAQGLSGRVDDTTVDSVGRIIGDYQRQSLTIAVIGKAKRGKSTLINALLGRTDDLVAPIDKLPTSSAVSRFSYGDHDKATVFFRDDRQTQLDPELRDGGVEPKKQGRSKRC
jgi:predicted GTPase